MNASALVTALFRRHASRGPVSSDIRIRVEDAKARAYQSITGNPLPAGNDGFLSGIHFFNRGIPMRKVMIAAAVSVCALAVAAGAGFFFYSDSFKGALQNMTSASSSTGTVVFSVGDAALVRAGGSSSRVRPGDVIRSGDTITTGKGSFVTVQISEQGNLKVNENTVLAFSAILDNNRTNLVVSQGSVYSKIKKMEKGGAYQIKTPVYVAAVRGTEFLASYDGAKGTLHVADGKVAMTATAKTEEKISGVAPAEEILSAKQGAVVVADGKKTEPDVQRYDLTRKQMLEMQKDSLYAEPDAAAVKGDKLSAVQETINSQIKGIDAQIAVENSLSPLERLRRDNKPLTMVYLRDGSQISGSMVSQNETAMMLDTGEGVISIPVKEIIRRVPIK